jgi:hypothetical protein
MTSAQLLEKAINGSRFVASHYDNDIDIAGPKQLSITTLAKPAYMTITVCAKAVGVVVLNTGLVIGTGGSPAAGDLVTVRARELAATAGNLTTIRSDYVLGNTGQSAGTVVETKFLLVDKPCVFKYRLKAATIYDLVFTSIADDNEATFTFEFDEE